MPTPEEIISGRADLIEGAITNYADSLEEALSKLGKAVSSIAGQLEKDGALLKYSDQNIQLVTSMFPKLVAELDAAGYNEAATHYLDTYGPVVDKVRESFHVEKIATSFSTIDRDAAIAAQQIDFAMFDAIGQSAMREVQKSIRQAVIYERDYTTFVKDLREQIEGTDKKGSPLANRANAFANTAIGQFDAQQTGRIGDDAGVTHYIYTGPRDMITRPWCKARLSTNKKPLTKEEIDALPKSPSNTTGQPNFIGRGGWNCRHMWRPAPQPDLKNYKKGVITGTVEDELPPVTMPVEPEPPVVDTSAPVPSAPSAKTKPTEKELKRLSDAWVRADVTKDPVGWNEALVAYYTAKEQADGFMSKSAKEDMAAAKAFLAKAPPAPAIVPTVTPAPEIATLPSSEYRVGDTSPTGPGFGPVKLGFWKEHLDLDLGEPKIPDLGGKNFSTGVVMIEPDGRIWIYEPKNHFGGYKAAFPKGQLEPDLTPQQNALKEAYEEAGLQAQLTGHLGDFAATSSVTRLYIGKRIAGDPTQFGDETWSVQLKTVDELEALFKAQGQKYPIEALAAIKKHLEALGDATLDKTAPAPLAAPLPVAPDADLLTIETAMDRAWSKYVDAEHGSIEEAKAKADYDALKDAFDAAEAAQFDKIVAPPIRDEATGETLTGWRAELSAAETAMIAAKLRALDIETPVKAYVDDVLAGKEKSATELWHEWMDADPAEPGYWAKKYAYYAAAAGDPSKGVDDGELASAAHAAAREAKRHPDLLAKKLASDYLIAKKKADDAAEVWMNLAMKPTSDDYLVAKKQYDEAKAELDLAAKALALATDAAKADRVESTDALAKAADLAFAKWKLLEGDPTANAVTIATAKADFYLAQAIENGWLKPPNESYSQEDLNRAYLKVASTPIESPDYLAAKAAWLMAGKVAGIASDIELTDLANTIKLLGAEKDGAAIAKITGDPAPTRPAPPPIDALNEKVMALYEEHIATKGKGTPDEWPKKVAYLEALKEYTKALGAEWSSTAEEQLSLAKREAKKVAPSGGVDWEAKTGAAYDAWQKAKKAHGVDSVEALSVKAEFYLFDAIASGHLGPVFAAKPKVLDAEHLATLKNVVDAYPITDPNYKKLKVSYLLAVKEAGSMSPGELKELIATLASVKLFDAATPAPVVADARAAVYARPPVPAAPALVASAEQVAEAKMKWMEALTSGGDMTGAAITYYATLKVHQGSLSEVDNAAYSAALKQQADEAKKATAAGTPAPAKKAATYPEVKDKQNAFLAMSIDEGAPYYEAKIAWIESIESFTGGALDPGEKKQLAEAKTKLAALAAAPPKPPKVPSNAWFVGKLGDALKAGDGAMVAAIKLGQNWLYNNNAHGPESPEAIRAYQKYSEARALAVATAPTPPDPSKPKPEPAITAAQLMTAVTAATNATKTHGPLSAEAHAATEAYDKLKLAYDVQQAKAAGDRELVDVLTKKPETPEELAAAAKKAAMDKKVEYNRRWRAKKKLAKLGLDSPVDVPGDAVDDDPKVALPHNFPPDPKALKVVKTLGGSTGAQLVIDEKTGIRYVRKTGNSAGHILNESLADTMYAALGANVPQHKLYKSGSGYTKLAVFKEGVDLKTIKRSDPARYEVVRKEIQKHLASDALMGNYDVIGLSMDNVLIDSDNTVWRIDNGGSLAYKATGGFKPADNPWDSHMSNLWTFRDPKYANNHEVFGDMKYSELISQLDARSKREAGVLKAIDDHPLMSASEKATLKAQMAAKFETAREVVKTGKTMLADGWDDKYTDKFGYHDHDVRKDLTQHMPKTLTPDHSGYGENVVKDASGKPFDSLRGPNSLVAKFEEYLKTRGGDHAVIRSYQSGQGGNSWQTAPRALKYFLAKARGFKESDAYWHGGIEASKTEYERYAAKYGEDAYRESMIAQHAFTYRFLQTVDFHKNNRADGTVLLTRTEPPEGWAKLKRIPGTNKATLKRGMLESTSIYSGVTYKGSRRTATWQTVPHNRIFGLYFLERHAGKGDSPFMGDGENEFTAMLDGLTFDIEPTAEDKDVRW